MLYIKKWKRHVQLTLSTCIPPWTLIILFAALLIECLFRLDVPTSNRRCCYCMKIIAFHVHCECWDYLTCVPKPARHVLCCQIDTDASSLNKP